MWNLLIAQRFVKVFSSRQLAGLERELLFMTELDRTQGWGLRLHFATRYSGRFGLLESFWLRLVPLRLCATFRDRWGYRRFGSTSQGRNLAMPDMSRPWNPAGA